jgi:CheY-like chemotaxis protein
MLSVTDIGVGIEETILPHLFEPFFTTKGVGKGTGLGLATCHGIVKQNQGHISVHSQLGAGTRFEIYFARTAEAVMPSTWTEENTPLYGSETILFVEDEPALRQVVSEALTAQGYTVLVAANGEDALTIMRTHEGTIHLLLTDVVMPKMSGVQLGEQFAALRPEAKVLYTSGYTDDTLLRHGIGEEKVAFLQKPYRLQTLSRKVREILEGSQGSQGSQDSQDSQSSKGS